jgi:hypothetical protein
MRIPLELEHLIKTATVDPRPPTLTSQLQAVEARRALEVEHYLRACALRLGLPERDTKI